MKAHKIYVVIGRTGEYSDSREWPVMWRHTLADAEACVAQLNEEARAFMARHGKYAPWEAEQEFRKTALDPQASFDYTGTSYHVWAVLDDPRGEA